MHRSLSKRVGGFSRAISAITVVVRWRTVIRKTVTYASITMVRLAFLSVLRRLFREIADVKPFSAVWSVFNPASSDTETFSNECDCYLRTLPFLGCLTIDLTNFYINIDKISIQHCLATRINII